MNKKLIAVDLDGTFLKSGSPTSYKISEYNKSIVKQLKDREDIEFCILTGRPYRDAYPVYKELGLTTPLATHGGASISYPNGDNVSQHKIPRKFFDSILDIEQLKGCVNNFLIEYSDKEFTVANDDYRVFIDRYNLQDAKRDNNDHKDFIMCLIDLNINDYNKDKIIKILEAIRDFNKDYNIHIWDLPEDNYLELEITSGNGGKANALRTLCNHLNIDVMDTYTFGDSANDLSMNLLSPNSFAVANATNELKKVSKTILEFTNDEDAVGRTLEELFLK